MPNLIVRNKESNLEFYDVLGKARQTYAWKCIVEKQCAQYVGVYWCTAHSLTWLLAQCIVHIYFHRYRNNFFEWFITKFDPNKNLDLGVQL